MADFFERGGRRLAYELVRGQGPAVVFLGGFRSDMTGTKALALRDWAVARGRAFLRFDYAGHGASEGDFAALGIGDWLEDARAAVALAGPGAVLVGSSMGGWIALLLAREGLASRVVTVAAAPDFPDRLLAGASEAERASVAAGGGIERPSDYAEGPYLFSAALFAQTSACRVFDRPLRLACPLRMLQGTADADVPEAVALRLLAHAEGDVRLTLVKGADHRFSTPDCVRLIEAAVEGG